MKSQDLRRKEVIEHLTPPPGITMPPYPAMRDRVYRWSLVGFVLGLVATAIFTATRDIVWIRYSQGWTALAMAVAGWTFLVWLKSWRYTVRALVLIGLVMWPFFPILGWAGTIAASAIVAGKEHHCFHFWSGRWIPWVSVLTGIALVFGFPYRWQAVVWAVLAWMWVPLLTGRFSLPLFEI